MSDASQPAQSTPSDLTFLDTAGGGRIAYCRAEGRGPGIVFCGGFMSDMTGTKALALEAHAKRRGQGFLRFDYRGHGQSSGRFADGTIGTWKDDTLAVFDTLTEGPQVLIGSSMGGWIALLLALERPDRIAGLIGIAAAPDFTEDLMWGQFDEAARKTLRTDRVLHQPSDYSDEPYTITMDLIEDGRRHLLLRSPIPITAPVRLLQGMQDSDVPYQHALALAERLESDDVQVRLIKNGDHRLSTDQDLAILCHTLDSLLPA